MVTELKIKKFINFNDGYDTGNGSGYGSGNGNGYGDGDGSGNGYGDGSGVGYGYGSGTGNGSGSGVGYGCGFGDGAGFGDGGSGYGTGLNYSGKWGIKFFNKQEVHVIDTVQTIIFNIKNNIAKGAVLNSDLTLTPCYIVKANNLFAHGKTLREAVSSVRDKVFATLNIEEKIDEFHKKFKPGKKYKGNYNY